MTDSEEDEDAQNLAVGPLQQFISDTAKIQKGVKRKAILTSHRHPLHNKKKNNFIYIALKFNNCAKR